MKAVWVAGTVMRRAASLAGHHRAHAAIGMRSLSMMINPACVEQLGKKAASEPHVDAAKLHLDDADPIRWTNKQLNRHVNAFAKGLVDSQFTPGSKLVVWTKDIAEGIVAQMGALKVGVKVTVLDSKATEADLAKAMEGARALLFTPTLQPNMATMEAVKKVIPEVLEIPEFGDRLISSATYPKLRWLMTTGFYRQPGMVKFQWVLNYDDPDPLPVVAAGTASYAGPGTPTEITQLPLVDTTVTYQVDDDTFAMMQRIHA